MGDPFGGTSAEKKSKAQQLADAINRILSGLVTRCTFETEVFYYFDIGIVGYSGERIGSVLHDEFKDRALVPIPELALKPLRFEDRVRKVSDGAGGLADECFRMPVWVDPAHSGGTPMAQALTYAVELLKWWVDDHRASYPPTLIHITDGESTDGSPAQAGGHVHEIKTEVGPVMFFNLHLSSGPSAPIAFPDTVDHLPDEFARTLFQMSSVLPDLIRAEVASDGYPVTSGSRAFAFNADVVEAVRFLKIGTRTNVNR